MGRHLEQEHDEHQPSGSMHSTYFAFLTKMHAYFTVRREHRPCASVEALQFFVHKACGHG